MNWYALCLRTLFFSFSSPLLQHQDTEVLCAWEQTMDFIFAPLFWWWNAIDVVPLAARALQKVQQRPTQPAPALLKPAQREDGRRRKVLDGKMAKDLNCHPCSSIPNDTLIAWLPVTRWPWVWLVGWGLLLWCAAHLFISQAWRSLFKSQFLFVLTQSFPHHYYAKFCSKPQTSAADIWQRSVSRENHAEKLHPRGF